MHAGEVGRPVSDYLAQSYALFAVVDDGSGPPWVGAVVAWLSGYPVVVPLGVPGARPEAVPAQHLLGLFTSRGAAEAAIAPAPPLPTMA